MKFLLDHDVPDDVAFSLEALGHGSSNKESRDRVSTALTNSGFKFPMGRTTINLPRRGAKSRVSACGLGLGVASLYNADG